MALNSDFIHFRKTNSVAFAEEFSEFKAWLFKKDSDGEYVNIKSYDSNGAVLKATREKELPVFTNITKGDKLNNAYFLDDIRVIYYRGIPYDSATDYITGAEYHDSDKIEVDPARHILLLPDPTKQKVEIDVTNLKKVYVHQLDDNGIFNPNSKDSSITLFVAGDTQDGATFTIRQSMVKGSYDDETNVVSYYGLKNYIDSRFKNSGLEEIIDTEWKDEV